MRLKLFKLQTLSYFFFMFLKCYQLSLPHAHDHDQWTHGKKSGTKKTIFRIFQKLNGNLVWYKQLIQTISLIKSGRMTAKFTPFSEFAFIQWWVWREGGWCAQCAAGEQCGASGVPANMSPRVSLSRHQQQLRHPWIKHLLLFKIPLKIEISC